MIGRVSADITLGWRWDASVGRLPEKRRGYAELVTQPGLVVIGSGPAGVSAAEAFRAHNGELPVQILTFDPALPYARPPLSKDFLRGETEDVALHPRQWYDAECHHTPYRTHDHAPHGSQRQPDDSREDPHLAHVSGVAVTTKS